MSTLKVVVIGATGLVGKSFVQESSESKTSLISSVKTITRRTTGIKSAKVSEIIEPDFQKLPEAISNLDTVDDVFFSGLGTTKAKAGGFENQYKIDHDVNLAAAKAAKEKGIKTYVLVSSVGASKDSYFNYPKMKGELEQDVIALQFPRTIIFRPGMLLGDREVSHGIAEEIFKKVTGSIYGTVFAKVSPLSACKDIDIAHAALELLKSSPTGDKPVVEIIDNSKILELAKNYRK